MTSCKDYLYLVLDKWNMIQYLTLSLSRVMIGWSKPRDRYMLSNNDRMSHMSHIFMYYQKVLLFFEIYVLEHWIKKERLEVLNNLLKTSILTVNPKHRLVLK